MQQINNSINNIPEWVHDFRQAHWHAFTQAGMPTRKHERWKYANLEFLSQSKFAAEYKKFENNLILQQVFEPSSLLRTESYLLALTLQQHRISSASPLLVTVNGIFMPSLSDLTQLAKGVIVCSLTEAFTNHPDLVKQYWNANIHTDRYPFASLNAAMFNDGVFVYLPDNCQMDTPIQLLSIGIGNDEFFAHPHHVIVLGMNSSLIYMEDHIGLSDQAYTMNIVTNIQVGKNAKLEHYKLQRESNAAVHLAHTFIQQEQNSSVSFIDFATGSAFARDDIVVKLKKPGAECRTAGFYRLSYANQYIDHHIDIDHEAPRSNSEMLYKGILDNKSKAVFNGRLHVQKDAQKINAYQANHNLLLSNSAEVYSKPELEIYADEVKCKHGATTGQIDQDALFYLCSRGIDHTQAQHMLLQGFAEEIMLRVNHPIIKSYLQEIL